MVQARKNILYNISQNSTVFIQFDTPMSFFQILKKQQSYEHVRIPFVASFFHINDKKYMYQSYWFS